MEADLNRYFGVPEAPIALEEGRLGIRRASVLVEQLPVGSSLWAAFQADDPTAGAVVPGWSNEAHLLAEVWSVLAGQPHPSIDAVLKEAKAADPLRRQEVVGWKARWEARQEEVARLEAEEAAAAAQEGGDG